VYFDIHGWLLLEQVDDCEQLPVFMGSGKWNTFSKRKELFGFCDKIPNENGYC
jgi:hypothetical protein